MNTWDCEIIKPNGKAISLEESGILVSKFIVDSPVPITAKESIEGRPGYIDMGTVYDGRTLHLECATRPVDRLDVMLFRDEVFRLFDSREYFYLVNKGEPGKRWHVKYTGAFSLSQIVQGSKQETFSVDIASDLPYAQSVGRTDTDPITMDSDKWQFVGAGLTLEEDMIYQWSQNNFRIYNGGDEIVDPRFHELLIKFKGASNGLTIKNLTTGDSFTFNQTISAGDELDLDGPRVLLNGESALSKSNRQLIRLAPGWNDIQVSGTGGAFTISFGFRWLYL